MTAALLCCCLALAAGPEDAADAGTERLAADASAAPTANQPGPAVDGGSALDELRWQPLVDVLAQYDWQKPTDGEPYNAFAVPRAHLGLEGQWRSVRARVLLEGVYSTQGGALVGTAGDSIVVRLREAWGGYRWRFLEARLGMVPTLVVPELEAAWNLRAVAPDALEEQRLVAPADFGATLRGNFPAGYGWAGVAVTNGEGYTQRELDNRKTVELAAAVRPLPRLLSPLEAMVNYQNGTTGTTSQRADRAGFSVLWSSPYLSGGVGSTWLWGMNDDGGRRGLLLEAFVRAELFDRLLLGVRVYWLNRDLGGSGEANTWLDLLPSVGVRLAKPLELFAVYHRALLSPLAQASLPGSDVHEFRLTLRVRWPLTSTLSQESQP